MRSGMCCHAITENTFNVVLRLRPCLAIQGAAGKPGAEGVGGESGIGGSRVSTLPSLLIT